MAKLYFYYSAMNAGKTTKLLQNNFNYMERGMKTLLYTFAGDDRYGVAKITSRIGLSSDANTFDSNTELFNEISKLVDSSNKKIACILIDEAQFLNKNQVKDLCRIVDKLNIPVLTYGLRTDFLGEPFEGSLYLLLWSDELVEVKTICHCGKKATMNAKFNSNGEMIIANNNELNNKQTASRQIDSCNAVKQTSSDAAGSQTSSGTIGAQIDIGGNEKYIALCRKHYFMGKLK